MWFPLDEFCLIELFVWVLVEFFEIGCLVFVSDLDVGVAVDLGFIIGDMVCFAFANRLPVVAEVAAFLLVVFIIAVVFIENAVLLAAAALVVTVVSVAAVVVGVGTIVEILNWVSGSKLWITVSHMGTSKQVYLFKYASIVWVYKYSLRLQLERSKCLEAFKCSEICRL